MRACEIDMLAPDDVSVPMSFSIAPAGLRYGFSIRERARTQIPGNDNRNPALAQSADNFSSLVGRVPLKELVRESTGLIEKRCIEAALEVTKGNRASAAEMLGLSRQSLYVKLRRYGIGDYNEDDS